jgi:hypothetical protein
MRFTRRLAQGLLALSLAFAGAANALEQLKVMIPAGPGGGFDQTGRSLVAAMQAAGAIKGAQFDNKGGAGGALQISQSDISVFVTRPISCILLVIALLIIVVPIFWRWRESRRRPARRP